MRAQSLLLPLFALVAARPALAQAPKVEELVVAPNEQNLTYMISLVGGHVASVSQKGSRWVVIHDGVEGPKFDQIIGGAGGGNLHFSPDGNRYAYAGRQGTEWVAMVDGKEAMRRPIGSNRQLTIDIRFSPNSKHWYFYYYNGSESVVGKDPSWVAWDGIVGPPGGQSNITVSPDGDHFVYVVIDLRDPNRQALILDGKPAGYMGSDPQFSSDGLHLFTIRSAPPIGGRPVTEALVDGKPFLRGEHVQLFIPPAGMQVVAAVGRGNPRGGLETWFLVVGGKKVLGSEFEGNGYPRVVFSADGKHYAAHNTASMANTLIVDGRKTPEYTSIDSIWFTPDSGKVVYAARSGPRIFVVVGDQESDVGFNAAASPLVKISRNGRVGFQGSTDRGNAVYVDGKVTILPRGETPDEFTFSPDGAHHAYAFANGVKVDFGPPLASTLRGFVQYRHGDPVQYLWSPDSKYTVSFGSVGNQGFTAPMGFFIGGKHLAQKAPDAGFPTFTPDSRHFFWLAGDGARGMMQVWLDGKMVYEFDDQGREPVKAPGGWGMGKDGSLTFVIQTVEGFKRVRITPGPDNGFEAFLATGKPVR